MATLTIGDHKVTIDDSFLSLPADQQQATVEEISNSLPAQPSRTEAVARGAKDTAMLGMGDEAAGVQAASPMPKSMMDYLPIGQVGHLVGGGVNLMAQKLGLPSQGDPAADYQQGMETERGAQKAAQEAHPGYYIGGQVAGAVPQMALPVAGARAASMAGKIAGGLATGAGQGSVYGFASGEGGFQNRAIEAGKGAAIGGAVGAAAPVVGAGISSIIGALRPSAVAGYSKGAVNRVAQAFGEDIPSGPAFQGRAAELGPQGMMADLGPSLGLQAETLANRPGAARNTILGAVQQRAEDAGARIKSGLDTSMASGGKVAEGAAIKAEAQAASPLFTAAKQFPDKLPVADVRSAVTAAANEADGPVAAALEKVRGLKVFGGDEASATQLHNARMALDDMLEGMNRDTSAGRNAKNAVKTVRDAIDEKLKKGVPGFAEADATFASAAAKKEALQSGQDVFSRTVSPDELTSELAGMSEGAREAFKKGVRNKIEEIMGTARKEATAAVRELSDKGWNREKLAAILGDEEASKILGTLEREKGFQELGNNIAGNSRTALRQQAEKAYPTAEPGALSKNVHGTTWTGAALTATQKVANALSGGAINARRAAIEGDAAKMLTAKGPEMTRVVEALLSASGRKVTSENVRQAISQILLGQQPSAQSQASTYMRERQNRR